MYGNVVRDAGYIDELLHFIRSEYTLAPTAIVPAKRGFYGETWRLNTAERAYFVKLDYSAHRHIYERSFPVVEYLCDNGIDFIGRIVKTANGGLSALFDGAVIGVFDWIDGDNIQNERTKIAEYDMLSRVYAVPTGGISTMREDFSGGSADMFFRQWAALDDERLHSLLENNRAMLEYRAARLKHFAMLCCEDTAGFVVTHGDPGGNVIMNGDMFSLIDWDDPILAPPERDAWFSCLYPPFLDWAGDSFHRALKDRGITYTLNPHRLAYYCYHSFFYYLTEYLDAWFDAGDRFGSMTKKLDEYFHGWIEEQIDYVDQKYV